MSEKVVRPGYSSDGARASPDLLRQRDQRMDIIARACAADPNCLVLGDPPPALSALARKKPPAPRINMSAVAPKIEGHNWNLGIGGGPRYG
jgi:hypothetical protein